MRILATMLVIMLAATALAGEFEEGAFWAVAAIAEKLPPAYKFDAAEVVSQAVKMRAEHEQTKSQSEAEALTAQLEEKNRLLAEQEELLEQMRVSCEKMLEEYRRVSVSDLKGLLRRLAESEEKDEEDSGKREPDDSSSNARRRP